MYRVLWALVYDLSYELHVVKYPEREAKKYSLRCKANVCCCIDPDSCSVARFNQVLLSVVDLASELLLDFVFVNYCPEHDQTWYILIIKILNLFVLFCQYPFIELLDSLRKRVK